MENSQFLPVYERVLKHLAAKYQLLHEVTEVLSPEDSLKQLVHDWGDFKESCAAVTDWQATLTIQEYICRIASAQQRNMRMFDRATRRQSETEVFSIPELLLFGELCLHWRAGRLSWIVPSRFVEQVSAVQIDESVTVEHLDDRAPKTLWVEWREDIDSRFAPWIWRAKGILITRNALVDAPVDTKRSIAQQANRQRLANDNLMLFGEIVSLSAAGESCTGYNVVVVLEDSRGIRFVPIVFGFLNDESVLEMLRCYEESAQRDRRRTKEAEQVWANVAMRLLLLAACHQLEEKGRTVIEQHDWHIKGVGAYTALIKLERVAATGRELVAVARKNEPLQPFRRCGR